MVARRVFISYRRRDSEAVVGRIRDHLVEYLGPESVFKDVDSIEPGEDFRTVLQASIRECDAMLVVVGPDWLAPMPGAQQARLFDPDDYVRAEIEQALAHRVVLIPVLVEGAAMPAATSLPMSVRDLVFHQAAPVRPDPDFHSDIERLLERPPFDLTIEREPRERMGRSLTVGNVFAIGLALAALVTVIVVAKGSGRTSTSGVASTVRATPSTSSASDTSAATGVADATTLASVLASSSAAATSALPTTLAVPAGVSAADAFRSGTVASAVSGYAAVPSEFIDVQADSTLPPEGRSTYEARHLVDRDPETAWTENVPGYGEGQHLVFRFTQPVPVERIEVWPGWQSSVPCRFEKNSRPSAMAAVASPAAGPTVSASSTPVDPTDPRSRLVILVPPNVYGDVTLTITGVTPGTLCGQGPYADTVISEVRFFIRDECILGFGVADGELVPNPPPKPGVPGGPVSLPTTC